LVLNDVGFIGRYSNGKPVGDFWIQMIGGGLMHGKFDDFIMKEGKEAEVVEVNCNEYGIPIESKFEVKSNYSFFYQPSTNESFGGGGPHGVLDPYERKWIRLEDSSIPNSGIDFMKNFRWFFDE